MTEDTKQQKHQHESNGNGEAAEAQKPAETKDSNQTIEVKEADYNKIVAELAEYKDKYVRLYAEFDNARKRMDREKQEFVKYANEKLLTQFLNILDNLELAVNAAQAKHEDYEAFMKGVEMVMAQIHEMLKKSEVKQIEAEGKKFDPNCHEVLMQEPVDGVEEGTVLEVFQKGYYYGTHVLRTAKVKLASKKE